METVYVLMKNKMVNLECFMWKQVKLSKLLVKNNNAITC